MSIFHDLLVRHDLQDSNFLCRGQLSTLQINLGNLCNQACQHCHVDASPAGTNIMSGQIIKKVVAFLNRYKIDTLDVTGGAPEMHPHFVSFIEQVRPLVDHLIVRSNLTVLLDPGREHLAGFLKKYAVHLICSMPCYLEENVDAQRGKNAYSKSIKALQSLNSLGYGADNNLQLDLVYNPIGPKLPPDQERLEDDYKKALQSQHGIDFNRLVTITNVPIKRFKTYLEQNGEYEQYRRLLKESFNPNVLLNIMCRTYISVGFDGKLYDCDFNQALGMFLTDEHGKPLHINSIDPEDLIGKEIQIGEHCLSCTAGCGSSCQGVLEKQPKTTVENYDQEVKEKKIKKSVKKYYGKTLQRN